MNVDAIQKEAEKLGKIFSNGDNEGLAKIFYITPDLNGSEKTVFLGLINKIGTGTIN